MKKYLALIVLFLSYHLAQSAIWKVGPTEKYKNPSNVSPLINYGDTIEIASGDYKGDVTTWNKSNIFIHGVEGTAYLFADGKNAGGKAIWVVTGTNVRIENCDFSGCKVPDKNGAGIRYEGKRLFLKNCAFHENEMGILTINDIETEIYFESCQFYNNGYGDGYSHNIYIGRCEIFEMKYCYSHHAKIGHNVKSRASINIIAYNRIMDEESGTSSMLIDLPNGGDSYIIGNDLMEGPLSENRNLISYGLENNLHNINKLFVVNNTMISKRNAATYINANDQTTQCVIKNNIFAGNGIILGGLSTCDSSSNLYFNKISDAKLLDPDKYNFFLQKESPCIDKGVNPGTINNVDLNPIDEYLHPMSHSSRFFDDRIDIGSHEYDKTTGVLELIESNDLQLKINSRNFQNIFIYDYLGNFVKLLNSQNITNFKDLLENLQTNSLYLIRIEFGDGIENFLLIKN